MNCAMPEAAAACNEQIGAVQDIKNTMFNDDGGSKVNRNDAKSTITELFPWVSEFKKMCKCIYVNKTMASLTELMQYYIRNVSISVNERCTKALRAAKLKDSISETLLLFLYIYRELSEDRNRSIYLTNMSDLLAMYIDMELKASRKSKEDHHKIYTRVTSSLYIYLEHSTEHLLDTLIKTQFVCRSYHRILDPIITKVIKSIPTHPESNIMYVRYLLIYCLWRKVNSDVAVKSKITTAAIASLGSPPTTFPPCMLEEVLPKVPKCQPNSAKYLMQQKFDIRKCCELFIQLCRENKGGSIWQEKTEITMNTPSSSKMITSRLLEVTSRENESMERIENNFSLVSSDKNVQNTSVSKDSLKSSNLTEQNNIKPLGTISTNVSITRTISKPIKPKILARNKVKKSNKIVIIDLTTDIAFEHCIKKRKSRKVAWLEEAKKKFDAKTIKASQKIKKKQMANNINPLKKMTLDQQLEDLLQPMNTTENTSMKNNLDPSTTQDMKFDNNKANYFEIEHKNTLTDNTESPKQLLDMNSTHKNGHIENPCTVPSSIIIDKSQSTKSRISVRTLSKIPNGINNVNEHDIDAILEAKKDEKMNDKVNMQSVIKQLIEKDISTESETCKRVESLRKICDLEQKHSKIVNTPAICAQDDPKEKADERCLNHNDNYPSITKDKLSLHIISSQIHHRNNKKDEKFDKTKENIYIDEKCVQKDTHKTSNSRIQCLKSVKTNNQSNKQFPVSITATETPTATTISNTEIPINNIIGYEQSQRSHVITENMKQPKGPESRVECISVQHDNANNTISFSITDGDHSNVQTDLQIGNCIEVNGNVKDSKSSNHKIRETIFENHIIDKKNISNIFNMSLCSNVEEKVNNERETDLNTNHREDIKIVSNKDYDKEDNGEELERSSVLCTKAKEDIHDFGKTYNYESPKEIYSESYEILHTKNVQNPLENKCIIQDPELQDNIDGLSLLASVSQHVSHLKTELDLKCDQIKVKDYASLKNSSCNKTDDETENLEPNGVSQIMENPTSDVIDRIVGIYPEDTLDKVALHVEVTSTTNTNADDVENGLSNNDPHMVETTINYETDALSNNLCMAENNMQSLKENTNVILNGETVMLLQKSPNSNLYIINKAVENARDHNSDDESCSMKEKGWIVPPEDCTSFEVINTSEHISFNLDLPQYNKDLPCQENKFSIGRSKNIKIEPEEKDNLMNLTEMKSYSKKSSLPADVLPVTSQIYQDMNVASVSISKSVDKRKSKSIFTYRQNIKQEFNNHITPNCGIQGCNGIHSHPHEVIEPPRSLHIPVTHPATIPSIYGNCAAGTDLCMPYHKHCTSVSCSLQINSTTSLHSHTKSANPCERSHCSCLNCTYDIVTHCRQCIHPATDSHVSCIESNSYFLPTHSSVQTSAVQEHDRTKSEAVINKLYDDQILCKIEQRVLQNNTLEKLDVQHEPEKLFKKDMENKLPLKKRLKAMLSVAYEKVPIKSEKLDNYPAIPDNYPAIPMMSIAELEELDNTQKNSTQIIKPSYELSLNEENSSHDNFHFNSNIVRRDYYKDMHISTAHHNLTKESTRNHEHQFRSTNDQSNAVCLETYQDKTFKTPAQRRDVTITVNPTSVKRIATEMIEHEMDNACKKTKKTQSSIRQTRSSKRNVPKVNYCYTDVDPEWNPSGESKRRRKKTSR